MTDLKPENVFLLEQDGQPDFVKIVDFGIAKVTRVAAGPGAQSGAPGKLSREEILAAAAAAGDSAPITANMTLPGSVMGTPAYMSPESIEGAQIDARADQYSLGCVLYEMLTGQTPFRSRSTAGMLMKHLSSPIPPLHPAATEKPGQKAVPDSLEALVIRLLAKTPGERFASMRAVEQALEHELDLILVSRGEKTVLPTALAGAIAGRGLKAALVLGKRQIPLVALLPLALFLMASGGLLSYRLLRGHAKPKPALLQGELLALRKQALEVLKHDLLTAGTPPPLQIGAAAGLGQSQEPSIRPLLEEKLKSAEAAPELRAQAAESLGQLGERAAVPALRAQVDDATAPPLVAVAAAAALRQLGEPHGQQALVALLSSKQPAAQFHAALRLCENSAAKARELLHDFLKRDSVPELIRLDIETCLARSGEEEARAALRTQMQAVGPTAARILAAARLLQLGERPAREYLVDLIAKKDPEQLLAARMLAGPDEPAQRDLFREVVATPQAAAAARQLGAEGLGAIGELFDARLLGTLLGPGQGAGASTTDPQLRQAAATAILQIASHDPSAWSARSLAWARSAINDSDWLVRQAAATVLGDSLAADAVGMLGGMLKDSDARVRRSAVRALGRRAERAALRALLPALEDSDGGVRTEALKALSRLLTTLSKQGARDLSGEVGPALRRLLDKGSPSERLLALGLLGRIGDRSQLERLLDFKDMPDAEVRRLFVEQVEGHPELLFAALSDREFAVRFAAARRLAELDDSRAVPVLTEALDKGGAAAISAYSLLLRLKAKVPPIDEILTRFAQSSDADRLAAVEAALRLPLEQALALLAVAARDPSVEVHRAAAEVAAELPLKDGQPAGLGLLQLLLNDADSSVRARAQALLGSLVQRAAKESAPAEPAPAALEKPAETPEKESAPGKEQKAEPAAEQETGPHAEAPSGPDAAAELEGLGLLHMKGPDYVQYQLDGKRWQYLSGKAQKLVPGPHHLVLMSGKQDVVIEEKKTKVLEVAPSSIEQAAHSGIDAYQHKDYARSAKLLERANQGCDRAHALVQPCDNLREELAFYLGLVHESQGRSDEAATDYQQVVDSPVRGRLTEKQRETANSALHSLAQSLGLVTVRSSQKGRCIEKKFWLYPGPHTLKVDGSRTEVKVKARQTLPVGECQ